MSAAEDGEFDLAYRFVRDLPVSAGTRKRALGPRSNRAVLAVFAKAALLVPAGFLAVHFLRFVFLW